MMTTPSFSTTGNGYFVSNRARTAARISALCSGPNSRRPAVAFTATGVHRCSARGTVASAASISASRLSAAPRGSPAYADSPGCVILNTSYSYSGAAPSHVWNL